MKSCFKVTAIILAGLFVFSCNEDTPVVPEDEVIVKTLDAENVTPRSAILCGSVSPASSISGKELGFIYSEAFPSLERGTRLIATDINQDGTFSVRADNFEMSSFYYFRAYCLDVSEHIFGETKAISTPFVREAVDLGLSVKWANADMGARDMYSFGDCYGWGETEPKNMDALPAIEDITGRKKWFSNKWWDGELNVNGGFNVITIYKYNTNDQYGGVDNKTVLDPEDDAAHVNWGDKWRMPTIKEMEELADTFKNPNYKWVFPAREGYEHGYGIKITYLVNGNSIFLPLGKYLSSSLCTWYPELPSEAAFGLQFIWGGGLEPARVAIGRNEPMPIRPVCD